MESGSLVGTLGFHFSLIFQPTWHRRKPNVQVWWRHLLLLIRGQLRSFFIELEIVFKLMPLRILFYPFILVEIIT